LLSPQKGLFANGKNHPPLNPLPSRDGKLFGIPSPLVGEANKPAPACLKQGVRGESVFRRKKHTPETVKLWESPSRDGGLLMIIN